jgi:MerR family transcriptional regulator, light-induced transcriptional regulator
MKPHPEHQAISISGVERDTGIPKDTLRIWERRYGFPQPVRDGNGDRLYPRSQVDRLRLIKRLIDAGFRPGKLIPGADKHLLELAEQCGQPAPAPEKEHELQHFMALIKKHHGNELKKLLTHQLMRVGLQQFVVGTIAPLNIMVGESWMRGDLQIFEEHLYTELTLGILRSAISAAQFTGCPPTLLLTTLPNEQHSLGLVMAEAILAGESAEVVALGTQTPVSNIASAAAAHKADIVGLSFSAAYPASMVGRGLHDLRNALPAHIGIWAGGGGVAPIRRPIDGVTLVTSLPALQQAVHDWRAAREPVATSAH